jgi:hypothetical protein
MSEHAFPFPKSATASDVERAMREQQAQGLRVGSDTERTATS